MSAHVTVSLSPLPACLFSAASLAVWYLQVLGLVMQLQKKKGGAKGKSKPPTRSTRVHTFFDFFSPPVVPESESELTETQMDALQSALERDYELGCATHAELCLLVPRTANMPSRLCYAARLSACQLMYAAYIMLRSCHPCPEPLVVI